MPSRRALAAAVVAAAAAPWVLGWAGLLPPADPSGAYVVAERCVLGALAVALVWACRRDAAPSRAAAMGIGGLAGAVVFVTLAGLRIVDPHEAGWLMTGDWAQHFGSWHVFRGEPWHWPPGRLDRLMFPDGTSIGLTDSIPIVAIPLKLASPWLPATFQFLGAWFALSFVLLGAWAARLAATATADRRLIAATGLLSVTLPILVSRVGHVALSSHWLLVAGITWHVEAAAPRSRWGRWAALGALSTAVHPYLAAMVAALALAWVAREVMAGRLRPRAAAAAAAAIVGAMWATAWLCGDFVVANRWLAASGVGDYSMDLLAPLNGGGWSALLPGFPYAIPGQGYEGLAYPGAGALALVLTAAILLACRRPDAASWWHVAPLAAVCLGMLALAIGPLATAGGRPVWRFDALAASPLLEAFRASGRFLWPAAYAVVLGAAAVVCARLRPRSALLALCMALALQVVDLHAVWQRNYRGTRSSAAFFTWESPLRASAWHRSGAVFRHLALVPAPECGPAPASLVTWIRLAGDQGLSLNSGTAARTDIVRLQARCTAVARQVASGALDPRTLYVVQPERLAALADAAGVTCVELDGLHACGEARQMRRWLD